MSLDAKARDVIVIGGGIIGLAVALSARERGMSVTVLERDRLGAGASSVAAGMLAPVAEAEFGDAAAHVLQLGLRSAALWPGFAARLEEATGEHVGYQRAGTLMVARDEDGGTLAAGEVVVATGAWGVDAAGVPEHARVPVRPVRGQVLRLRDPAGPGMLGRVVRVQRSYLVPRADGGYVLGATVEERGFDLVPAVGGVYELLRDAHEVVPSSSELQIEELCVGLRPGTPDNLPLIGRGALARLWWSPGHYRNGVLLAPLTGELVATLLAREPAIEPEILAACAPARFA